MKSFCTVITRSHLPFARALSDSLRAAGNPEELHVLITDLVSTEPPPSGGGLRFVALDELADAGPPLMRCYFDAFEFCNALKPFLVSHLFAQHHERVIYLDVDLLVTGSFSEVWDQMESAPLLLTPHQLVPPPLSITHTTEIDIVDQGLLNGGFAAWRRCAESVEMLDWLRTRLPVYGFCDRPHGMFVDQKLLPLLPHYFPRHVEICRDPRLNIAFWNVHERAVAQCADARWEIDGSPVVFFHLSGYRLEQPGVVCTYMSAEANAAVLANAPWLASVLARYHQGVATHATGSPPAPYPFKTFDGIKLTKEFRRLLFNLGRLERSDPAFRRVWIREKLRTLKRTVTRFLPDWLAR